MNLALQMRPTQFPEVIGQSGVVSVLQNKLKANDLSTGYLFSGETGTGKTTLAEILAKEIQKNHEPDILRVNCGDDNGVDFVRELVFKSVYSSLSGLCKKIYILNECHRLTNEAQNCLLDPLENEDSPTIWILTTTDLSKVIKPLQDRCLNLKLTNLKDDERRDLIYKAYENLNTDKPVSDILAAIEQAEVCLPRQIINAVERWAAGLSPAEAIQDIESDPLFTEIAKEIMFGRWPVAMLKKIKNVDAKALRCVIAGFLRNQLLTSPGIYGTVISDTLRQLCIYAAYESGVDLAGLYAVLYTHCQKIKDKI